MKNGVPYDVAFCFEPDERLAAVVVFGELEGSKWDWDEMRWLERDEYE